MSTPVEIPRDVMDRVHAMCLALPEVDVRIDESRSPRRSTAYAFDIRRRPFCLLVATSDPAGRVVPLIVVRARPDEQQAMLASGHPYFPSRAGFDRVGVVLSAETDWEVIREIVTDSYRKFAPKKLIALIDE